MVLKINSLPFYTLILIGSRGSAAVALTALGAVLGVCVCVCPAQARVRPATSRVRVPVCFSVAMAELMMLQTHGRFC